jgi:hypothetical protein
MPDDEFVNSAKRLFARCCHRAVGVYVEDIVFIPTLNSNVRYFRGAAAEESSNCRLVIADRYCMGTLNPAANEAKFFNEAETHSF